MITFKKWVLINFAGWFMGIVLVLTLSVLFDSLHIEGWQFIVGVGMGLGVGFAQWLALRKAILVTKKWIWFTVLGLAAPFLIFDFISHFGGQSIGDYYIFICVAIGGIAVGLLQQHLLKKHIADSQNWALTNIVGWMLAVLAFSAINYTKQIHIGNLGLFFLNLTLMLVGGPILGYLTGISLKKITSITN